MPDVIGLGEPMVEFCATGTGKLSQVELFKRGWGGDTSNFAVAAARLGCKVAHVCRLGEDEFGRSFLDLWEKEGMDLSRVIVEPEAFTAIYIISLMEDGGHDFTYYRAGAAASRYSIQDLDLGYIQEAEVLHTSGITLAVSETLREAAFRAMEVSKEAGNYLSFDINMRPKLWNLETARKAITHAFQLVDIVFASMEDMNILYGISDPEMAVQHIIKMGVETAVIKHGGKGCLVSTDKESFMSPGYKVDVIDTTGAGDAFDGAWITGYLQGWEIHRIASFANSVGAITATGLGAVAPIPTMDQALQLMKEQER